jgi:hypothetical protein
MGKYPPLESINREVLVEETEKVLVEVEKDEYWLLYYGEWKRRMEGGTAKAYPELTYCVSIGDLTADMAENIAREYEINYRNGRFHGFTPDSDSDDYIIGVGNPDSDEGYFGPFWELYLCKSLSESFRDDCVKPILRFEDDKKSGVNLLLLMLRRSSINNNWWCDYEALWRGELP